MSNDQLIIIAFLIPPITWASSLCYWSARMLVTARYAAQEKAEAEKVYRQIMDELKGASVQAPYGSDFSLTSRVN